MGFATIERMGRTAIVRFDRNNRANALSLSLMRELTDVAATLNEEDLSAVILTGRPGVFSLGFDLKDAEAQALADAPLSERRKAFQIGRRMCRAWAELEPITISAVSGWCVGGGLALAVSTDFRTASEDAAFYAPEIERGMNMSWGSAPRIVNLIGPARAKRMIALAERVDAETAAAWGLVDAASPDPMAAARALAARAEAMPPVALRMCKGAVDAYANALSDAASWADFDQFALTRTSEDYEEGVAAFLEGRPAKFSGR